MPVDIESDPLFQLLTDALRAGPGSPEWRDAVAQLRARGAADAPGSDDYQLLITAREHLSSGRDFRTVRAGAGFTRKLFSTIDQEPAGAQRPALPMASLIAGASAVVILIVLALVAWRLSRGPTTGEQPTDVAQLEATYFPNVVASATFIAADGEFQPPADWQKIGRLPLAASNGSLRPGPMPSGAAEASGGGLVTTTALPADQPFAVEADVVPPGGNGDPVLLEVFISDSPDFSPDRATSAHELVFLSESGSRRVVVDGQAQELSGNAAAGSGVRTVRVVVSRDQAVVKVGDTRLWAGPHHLAADKPRYAGVRFIRRPGKAESSAAVSALRVTNRPPPAGAGTGQ